MLTDSPDHPLRKNPLKWALTQNMLLMICLKAMLTKLDPEVATEVAQAMNAVPDDDGYLQLAVVDILERVLPTDRVKEIHDRMAETSDRAATL